MTGRRKKAQAILFSAIMVISMVGLGVGGLAGSAAAATDDAVSDQQADDVVVQQDGFDQNVTFEFQIGAGEEADLDITADLGDASGEIDAGGGDLILSVENVDDGNANVATSIVENFDEDNGGTGAPEATGEAQVNFNEQDDVEETILVTLQVDVDSQDRDAPADNAFYNLDLGADDSQVETANFNVAGVNNLDVSAYPSIADEQAEYTASGDVVGEHNGVTQVTLEVPNSDADSAENIEFTLNGDTWSEGEGIVENTDGSNEVITIDFDSPQTFSDGDSLEVTAENINNPGQNEDATLTLDSEDFSAISFTDEVGIQAERSIDVGFNEEPDTVGGVVNVTLDDTDGLQDDRLGIQHNYTGEVVFLNEDNDFSAEFFAAKSDDAAVTVVDSNEEPVDPNDFDSLDDDVIGVDYTVDYYFLTNNPDSAIDGETSQVNTEVFQWYDSDAETGDRYQEAVNWTVYNNEDASSGTVDGTQFASGSVSNGDFTWQADFNVEDQDYVAYVGEGTDRADDGVNAGNATVDVAYDVDLTLDPAEPVFEDELSVDGTVVDSDGEGQGDITVRLVDPDGVTQASANSLSSGSFVLNSEVDDASEDWGITIEGAEFDETTAENITVGAQQANLTMTADPTPEIETQSTFEFTLEDAAGDALVVDDGGTVDGYLNVTGPFDESHLTTDEESVIDVDPDGEYVHLNTTADWGDEGYANFTAAPVSPAETIEVSLEVEDSETYDGAEDTQLAETYESVDYVAEEEPLDVSQLGALNVNIGVTEPISVGAEEDLAVTITGADGSGDDVTDPDSTLENATVTVTGPGVDEEWFYNESETPDNEDVVAEEGGELTVSTVAYTNETVTEEATEEHTDEQTVEIDGDVIGDTFSPAEVSVDDEEDVSLTLTDTDGEPINVNRNVTLQATDNVFNASGVDAGSELNISTIENVITIGGEVVDTYTTTDGSYVAENITFEETGTADLIIVDQNENTRVNVSEALEVGGVEVFDVQSDDAPFLTGAEEQANFTVYEDGERLNGSDLTDAIDDTEIAIEQNDTDITVSDPAFADTSDEFEGDDAIQATINANVSATADVEVDVQDDGADRTGSGAFDVVEPEITTDLGDDVLTEGVTTESVNVTVIDPRTDDPIEGTDALRFQGNGTEFNVSGEDGPNEETGAELGESPVTVDLDADGQATVDLTPNNVDDPANDTLVIDAEPGDSGFYGPTDVDADEQQLFERVDRQDEEVHETIGPDFEEEVRFILRDANGDRLDDRTVNVTINDDVSVGPTVDGIFTVDFGADIEPTAGDDIDFNVESDYNGDITVDTIEVRNEADLTLEIDGDEPEDVSVQQGDTLNDVFILRSDTDDTTSGVLEVREDDEVVDTIDISADGTDATIDEEAGEYELAATKDGGDTTTFFEDTVNVTVEEPAGPEGYAITDVTLDPNEVESNATQTHDLTYTVTNASNDGGTDTYTVTLPSSASFESADSVNVTDATGTEIQVEGGPSLQDADGGTNNEITFDIAPDNNFDTSAVTVEATVTVNFPDVDDTVDVTLGVDDSSQSEIVTATTPVTIGDAGSPLDGTAGEYDSDGDGQITLAELATAGQDYTNGDLTLSELAQVGQAYTQTN